MLYCNSRLHASRALTKASTASLFVRTSIVRPKCQEEDPLFYGSSEEKACEIPKFQGGKKIYEELNSLMRSGLPLTTVLTCPPESMTFFQKHFPNVVSSNSIGMVSEGDLCRANPNLNHIAVELDSEPEKCGADAKDVYIGGPAALFAAAIQAHDKIEAANVLYGHDGLRGVSNWKGSASYFHIRDCIPVYYWPDNSGIYTVYCTLKHLIQKQFFNKSYTREVYQDPNFNKLRLNFRKLLSEPMLFWLMTKNTWNTVKDVNLHMTKTHLREPESTTAFVSLEHARLTHDIVPRLKFDKPVLMINSDHAKALHLHLGEGAEESLNVFRNLKRIIGDAVRYARYSDDDLQKRGYDSSFVRQGLEFPNDGYIPPYVDQVLEKKVLDNGGAVNSSMKLRRILVVPTNSKDYKASRIVWENTKDGSINYTPVKTLYLSLGPMAKVLEINKEKSWSFNETPSTSRNSNTNSRSQQMMHSGYKLPWLNRFLTFKLRNRPNIMNRMMWATGLSSCVLVKVDKSIVPECDMRKFRDHIDAHNKHSVRLAEKEMLVDGRAYQLFVLQFTGGGHFPDKNVHAEAALNVLKANFVPLLGLENNGVEYEIIQARSCARGIAAQNVFRFSAPLSNMVQLYGVGGIGMTTMAPNALLMKAILGTRQKLGSGKISVDEFSDRLKGSMFTEIPHWPHPNLFTRNYAQFVDGAEDPRIVAQKLRSY